MQKETKTAYHNCMLRNYRDIAKANSIDTTSFSDQELLDIINYWQGIEDLQDAIMDDLKSNTKRSISVESGI